MKYLMMNISDEYLVICVETTDKYTHHRKLEVGGKYLLKDNGDSIYIRTIKSATKESINLILS